MAPPRTSTIPDNVPLTLPPIDAPAKKGTTSTPIVYTVRLTDEDVSALIAADNPTVKFSSDTKGVFSVPQLRDIPFTVRPTADAHADTARAVCYSRRGSKLRTVGPVVANLAIEQRLSTQISDMTKKRSIDATMAKSGREVKKLDTLPSDFPASKRPRVSKTTTKRPRSSTASAPTTRRPALTSQPVMPQSKPVPPSASHHPSQQQQQQQQHHHHHHRHSNNINNRSPSAPSSHPLRSAPASTTHSPASPALPARSAAAPRPPSRSGPTPPGGIAKRGTPTRPALGAMPRKPSPATALPAASLPRPGARRQTPTASRGPSPGRPGAVSLPLSVPAPMSTAGAASPRSPRLASGLRSRPRDRTADIRRTVVHALALRDCTLSALKARLRADDGSETYAMLLRAAQDVADKRGGMLRLKDEAWGEVSDGYEGYSDGERARVRGARPEAGHRSGSGGATRGLVEPNTGGGNGNGNGNGNGHGNGNGGAGGGGLNGNGADGAVKVREIGTHGMSDSQLDHRLEAYERDEGRVGVGKVTSEEDEREVRRRFAKWYPVYQAVVGRMEEMRKMFRGLEKRLGEAQGARERDLVVREIQASHSKYRSRHKRYVDMLPVLHKRLKEMHRALGSVVGEGGV